MRDEAPSFSQEKTLSPEELQRLISFFEILIKIDRKNEAKTQESRNYEA